MNQEQLQQETPPEITKEGLLDALSQEVGEPVQEATTPIPQTPTTPEPTPQATPDVVPETPQAQEVASTHPEENPQPSATEEAPAPEPTPITLGKAFDEPQGFQPNTQPQLDQTAIDRMIDERVNTLVNQQKDAAEQTGEESPELNVQDMRQAVREEILAIDRVRQEQQQKLDTVHNYMGNLNQKLKNVGVNVETDPIMKDWVSTKFSSAVQFAEQKLQRPLQVDELKEVANWHTEEVEKALNLRTPGYKPQVQAVSPATQAVAPPPTNAVPKTAAAQLEQEYTELAKKQPDGRLTPSQASAYKRKLMQVTGASRIKF